MFTPLEIVLGVIIVWISILWGLDQHRWAKRESELLDRIMAKHYQEYILAEDVRKKPKLPTMSPVETDILPIT